MDKRFTRAHKQRKGRRRRVRVLNTAELRVWLCSELGASTDQPGQRQQSHIELLEREQLEREQLEREQLEREQLDTEQLEKALIRLQLPYHKDSQGELWVSVPPGREQP